MKQSVLNNYVRTCLGVCLLLFGVSIGTAMADSVIVDGVEYTTDSSDYTAKVTGYTTDLPADLVIPSVISYGGDEYSVTSIERGAFVECSSLTSIVIAEGVTSINIGAFIKCSNLISVTIPESVTSIGEHAFAYCN